MLEVRGLKHVPHSLTCRNLEFVESKLVKAILPDAEVADVAGPSGGLEPLVQKFVGLDVSAQLTYSSCFPASIPVYAYGDQNG